MSLNLGGGSLQPCELTKPLNNGEPAAAITSMTDDEPAAVTASMTDGEPLLIALPIASVTVNEPAMIESMTVAIRETVAIEPSPSDNPGRMYTASLFPHTACPVRSRTVKAELPSPPPSPSPSNRRK